MMTRFLFPAALLLLLLQMSCAKPPVQISPEKAPEVIQPQVSDYVPKKVYNLSFDSAWEGTLQSLRETNMPLTVQDRDKSIIRTEYIKGAEVRRLFKTFSTRYKYNILLFRESETRTALNVRCLYEIKEKSALSFGNANDLYPDEVIGLEKELYQIIESTLRRAEASRPAGPSPPSSAERAAKGVQAQPQIFLITKKSTHLRAQPSTQSKIILTFKPGRKVEKIEESGNWVKVRIWETTTGWVLKDFLEEAPP
jgi:hypothetical protein